MNLICKKNIVPIAIILLIVASFLNTIFYTFYKFIQAPTYIQSFFVICIIPIVIYYLFSNNNTQFFKFRIINSTIITSCLYICIHYFISNINTIQFDHFILSGIYVISYFLLILIFINNKPVIRNIFYSISLIGFLQIGYAGLQYIDILPTLFGFKYGGTFGNPGDFANFLALTYTITLGLFLNEKQKWIKFLSGINLFLHLFIIVISLARTAWIAVFVSTIYILIISYKESMLFWFPDVKQKKIDSKKVPFRACPSFVGGFRGNKWLFFSIIFAAIILLSFGAWKVYEMKVTSANGRLFIWQLCLQLIGEKPLFGHGYESFLSSFRYAQIDYFASHPLDMKNGMIAANSVFAFNDLLQFMVEYGIVGGVLLFSFFVLPFRKTKLKNNNNRNTLTIIRATLLALFVCSMFSYPLQNQTIVILFVVVLAIYSSIIQDCSKEKFTNITTVSPIKIGKVPFRGFRDNTFVNKCLIILILIASIFLGTFNYRKITNGLKWKHAYSLLQTNPQEGAALYDSIFDFMKHDRSFISNYGLSLYKNEEYQKLVDYYDQYERFNPSSDILLMIGESYEKLENYSKAEEKYRMASNLIPYLFVPRYKLFKLYQKQGEHDKALAEAKAISELKIKIYSDIVKNIKTEVNEYLYNSRPKEKKNHKTCYQ